ncbi:MAG: AlkZ family DNA glycosylase [Fimbriimonadaceae bacterium]|nr:AlkZ family DNA glycosylase [Chitinophagales bacterium]
MTVPEIIQHRLLNQQIAETIYKKPEEIVSYMAAMQAQEFAMAKWAIGLRLPKIFDSDVEQAFNDGKILRTHLMRPTWHFVAPDDIRWILLLTAPRVHAINAFMYRKLELDKKIFNRCNDIIIRSLEGGKQLVRTELNKIFKKKKIIADGLRLGYICMYAELEGIICSGARKGKQFTYALLEERVKPVKQKNREEALAELCKRYFISRSPATLNDFAIWSGLTMKDARDSIAMNGSKFQHKTIQGNAYIINPLETKNINKLQKNFLMPDYDEYGMSYKDRSAIFSKKNKPSADASNHMLIIDGVIEGTWKQEIKNKKIIVETNPFAPLNKIKQEEVNKAVKKYITFFNQ